MISYLYTKRELTVFTLLVCGKNTRLPMPFAEMPPVEEFGDVIASLEKKGFISESGGTVHSDLVQSYLVTMLSSYEKKLTANNGKIFIMFCRELIIVLAPDPHNSGICRMIPFRDDRSLAEWAQEESIIPDGDFIYPSDNAEIKEEKTDAQSDNR